MRTWSIGFGTLALVAAVTVPPAVGHERYRSDTGGGCAGCHGSFLEGFSPRGSIFPYDSNHIMHRGADAMNTECNLCHSDGDDRNPYIGFSDDDGFGGGPGFGCAGCHGRDYGDGIGVKAVGLREVHRRSGVASCGASSCHSDDPDPLPESVLPPYYGSYETRAWDSCNRAPYFGENFTLDLDNHLGLDNDGDGLYDADEDTDCPPEVECPADVDGDGTVAVSDLLIVLADWGLCGSCPGDVDDDGMVGVTDLLAVLAGWGPC
jgi:hypothetical protein